MDPDHALTRREAIKTLGAGAAFLSLGLLPGRGGEAAPAGAPQPFALPPLGYAYNALERHIDARTMEIHHSKHHQAYVANANKALVDYPELHGLTAEEILRDLGRVPEKIRTTLRNNVGGHANHTLFWGILSSNPSRVISSSSRLSLAFASAFGPNLDAFKQQFTDVAMKRFGSGWAWLSARPDGSLLVHSTANQDSPLSEGLFPIVGLDVWEHAYYLHYQNRRADYVASFWNILNWTQAEAHYAAVFRG